MTALFPAPAIFELPISKGGDLFVAFVYKPLLTDEGGVPILDVDGNKQYVASDYPANSAITLAIDTDAEPIMVEGEIDGSMATFLGDKLLMDTVKNRKLWRVVLTYDGGLDVVLCNGTTARFDGKSS